MLVAHLVHDNAVIMSANWWLWLGECTRFAAAGFILVSGLTIGHIFGQRKGAYSRLIRRAGEVLLAHFAATLLAWCWGYPGYPLSQFIPEILMLQVGYDLLPFYVVMLLSAPAMLWLLRRKLWWVLIGVVVVMYAVDMAYPDTFLLPLQQLPGHGTFRILRWQAFFILGMTAGFYFRRYDAWSISRKMWLASVGTVASVVLHLLAYDTLYGLDLWPNWVFWKQVLTVPEFAKYLALCVAIFVWTDVGWRWLQRPMRPAATLGRHALPVYVVHVYFIAPIAWLAARYPMPEATKLLWLVGGVACLWAFAVGTERLQKAWPPTRYAAAPVTIVVCILYMAIWQLW